jgi:AI-2 transport protein TqsA
MPTAKPASSGGNRPALAQRLLTQRTVGSGPQVGIFVLAALVIAAAGLHLTASIVGPIFLVLTLVITVHPIRAWLVRRRVPRWLASTVALLSVYALLFIVIGSVVWSIVRLAGTLPQYADEFTALLDSLIALSTRFGVGEAELREIVSKVDLTSFTGVAQSLLSGVSSGVSLLVLMLTVVVFIAFDAAGIDSRISLIRATRPAVAAGLVDFSQSVRKYWIVTTVFGLIVAIIDVVGLLIIGVPLALTWGVLAFVTNYIPNVGFLLGLVPPALIALLNGGVGDMLAVIIVYAAINVVIQTLIQPRFTGDAVGITATVAFVSLIFWSFLLGALGALLAVPATLFVKALLVDHSPDGRWFGALIDSTPQKDST